jgi:DNA-binding NarL/FixJ family response regulator
MTPANGTFLIVDDHDFILQGVESLLKQHFPGCTVHKAKSAEEALQVLNNQTDLLISDVSLPGKSGIELAELARLRFPELKIISLTQHTELWVIKQLLNAPVDAIVLKENEQVEILIAIESVSKNENYYTNSVQQIIISNLTKKSIPKTSLLLNLTLREKEILELIAKGKTTNEIAEQLFLSPKTVEVHRKNLFLKFDVKNAVSLVKKAIDFELI